MLKENMALMDFLKPTGLKLDQYLGEKFDYQPLSKRITNLIPPNVRQFGYDLFGGEQDFTEKDLSPDYQEELKGIANTALMKGKDTINYEDYEQGTMDQSLIKNLMSKNFNLKTLIGTGKITIDENGEMIVTDRFNFDDKEDIKSLSDVKEMFSGIVGAWKGDEGHYGSGGLYSAIREIAKYMGSGTGKGSKVNINLGKYQV
jgi:hypothetical protein|tara:strand:- start:236 stop:841 length:606 start_codon:yes stop_codon:yes gene_type:complete